MSVVPEDERAWIESTQGLCTPVEGDWLASRAAEVHNDLAIVEIGSHTGQSTMWLAAGSRQGNGAHVYAVDPWPDPGYSTDPDADDDPFGFGTGDAVYRRFLDNTANYEDLLTPIRLTSKQAALEWKRPIGLLYIDAIHTYEAVAEDVGMWSLHLLPGSWLALNDYYLDPQRTKLNGPGKYAIEQLEISDRYEDTDVVWNTWVGRLK